MKKLINLVAIVVLFAIVLNACGLNRQVCPAYTKAKANNEKVMIKQKNS